MTDSYQFYPTPRALAQRAWDLFQRDVVRVLEPSAGTGALMEPFLQASHRRNPTWDAIECNPDMHPLIREKGGRLVAHDFLAFRGGEVYSHIALNPPFAQGVQHLLHAWTILYEGEIVCILNAESIRNPFSKERQQAVRLIEQHGSVEFIQNAFQGEEVEREAEVEVALVYLCKEASGDDVVGRILEDLQADGQRQEDSLKVNYQNQLALPQGFVEDLVLRFDAAVLAAKECAVAQAKASYYSRILGQTLSDRNQQTDAPANGDLPAAPRRGSETAQVRAAFAQQYDELKDKAWSGILRSTEVLSKLSYKAQRRLESEFEKIKSLEFTASNVYGFLCGLSESAGEIQMAMVCDVFDEISRYHEDNSVFYMGWKSNGKHRTAGMRIKTTRFVHPGHSTNDWDRRLKFESRRLLSDFDRVFAMLDGKHMESVYGLVELFEDPVKFKSLREGGRESSDYFEVRYYPKRGTLHFFPKRKDLVDRLNRLVGAQRQWLPPSMEEASADFVKQYEQADKFDKSVRQTFADVHRKAGGYSSYALNALTSQNYHRDDREQAQASMAQALEQVLAENGIHPFEALDHGHPEQLRLAA